MKRNEILGERFDRDDDEGHREKRAFKRAELQHELGHERNNIQVVINGKPWKVFSGRGTAGSREEFQHLQKMQDWAKSKSAASGKKWSVHLTGADAMDETVVGQPEPGTLKNVDPIKKTATITTKAGDTVVPMQNVSQDPNKPGSLSAQVDAADKSQMKPGAPVKVTTVTESISSIKKLAGL